MPQAKKSRSATRKATASAVATDRSPLLAEYHELAFNLATLRAASSIINDRVRLADRAGLTYEEKRDSYKALGYKQTLTTGDYRARYRRGGIAATIVEAFPSATWRGGGELIEDEDATVFTKFEEAWDTLATRLSLWPVFQRGDILAGLGRYSVLLIGCAKDANLDKELPKMRGPEDIIFVEPYGEDDAQIDKLVDEGTDPRYGRPESYQFKRLTPIDGTTGAAGAQQQRKVHWSRVIHIVDKPVDDTIFGQPRLERVWNYLDDLEKVHGGGSEAFWLRAHQGYVASIKNDTEVDDEDLEDLKKQIDEFAHNIRRTIGQRGVDFKALGSDVANFDRNVSSLIDLIAGTTGIPQRILTGSEMGELASSQDKTNWNERVSDRRLAFAGPTVVRQLADRLIKYGALPKPQQYEVRWPEVKNLTEKERADTVDILAGANQKYGGTIVTADELRGRFLNLPPLEDVNQPPAVTVAAKKKLAMHGPRSIVQPTTQERRLSRPRLLLSTAQRP